MPFAVESESLGDNFSAKSWGTLRHSAITVLSGGNEVLMKLLKFLKLTPPVVR